MVRLGTQRLKGDDKKPRNQPPLLVVGFFYARNSARLMAKNSLNRNGDEWNDDDDVDDVVDKTVAGWCGV